MNLVTLVKFKEMILSLWFCKLALIWRSKRTYLTDISLKMPGLFPKHFQEKSKSGVIRCINSNILHLMTRLSN